MVYPFPRLKKKKSYARPYNVCYFFLQRYCIAEGIDVRKQNKSCYIGYPFSSPVRKALDFGGRRKFSSYSLKREDSDRFMPFPRFHFRHLNNQMAWQCVISLILGRCRCIITIPSAPLAWPQNSRWHWHSGRKAQRAVVHQGRVWFPAAGGPGQRARPRPPMASLPPHKTSCLIVLDEIRLAHVSCCLIQLHGPGSGTTNNVRACTDAKDSFVPARPEPGWAETELRSGQR
jgi:hypothetical protein